MDDRLLLAIDSGLPVFRSLGPVFQAANDLAAAAMDLLVPVTRWVGTVGGHPLTIMAAGRSHWAQYLAARAETMGPADRPGGPPQDGGGADGGGANGGRGETGGLTAEVMRPVTLGGLKAATRRWEREADVVTLRAGALVSSLFAHRYLRLPEWVTFGYPLTPYRAPEEISSRSIRHSLAELRHHSTTWEVSRLPEDLRFFYERVYRPTVLARYGREARLFGYPFVARTFARTGIMWVRREGRRVAGVAFDRCGLALRARLLGVLDADPELYRIHVPALIYYHFIQMSRQAGFATADFGGCRAPLTDGLTAHKVRWGMTPRVKRDSHFYLNLRVCRDSPATRLFLARLPCFLQGRGGLAVMAFHDPACPGPAAALALARDVRGDLPKILVTQDAYEGADGYSRVIDSSSGLVAALEEVPRVLRELAADRPAGPAGRR